MTSFDVSVYKSLYIKTSKEYLNNFKKNIVQLLKNSEDKNPLEEAHRMIHSVKSESMAMGFTKTGNISRVLELYLYEVIQNKRSLSTDTLTVLLKTADLLIRSVVNIEQKNQELDLNINKLKKELQVS